MNTIIQTFWTFFLNVIMQFVNDICYPIDQLLESSFADIEISTFISNFYGVLNNYVVPGISWFINLIPPYAWGIISMYYSFVIILYGIVLVSHLIFFPLKFIKKYIPAA